ncbi:A_thal_3526 domain-containing protein [Cephalotus follicularis]|uniref:A_thal_3526 domain-containing protein n=1 Tax=Cephalotus follicularis TaxID=3775 RepID=A0A1Q3C445_CEPFO|nr:A_thal_3526 domain-containing protein [Cephalotus follicularis]
MVEFDALLPPQLACSFYCRLRQMSSHQYFEYDSTQQIQSSTQISHNHSAEAPLGDSGSISASSNDSRKVSLQDIELVQNLIERCIQLYMNRDEVVKTLLTRARIDPEFTTLVWQKLEEENTDFFRAYHIRLELKKQVLLFNHLLEYQYHQMKYPVPPKVPLAPIQSGIHPMPVQSTTYLWDYPVPQPPPIPATGQPHHAPGNFHPSQMNSGNDMVMDSSAADIPNAVPPGGPVFLMSEMPVSSTSVASDGHFPFTASDISRMGVDTSALDTAFTSDVSSSVGLQLGPDGGAGNSRSLDQIQWNFSYTDLTADLPNWGDLGVLGSYPGSHFHPSDSEFFLDLSRTGEYSGGVYEEKS